MGREVHGRMHGNTIVCVWNILFVAIDYVPHYDM